MTDPGRSGNYIDQVLPPVERRRIGGEKMGGTDQIDIYGAPLTEDIEIWQGYRGSIVGLIEFGQQHIGLIDLGEPASDGSGLPERFALARVSYDASKEGPESITLLRNESGNLVGNFLPRSQSTITLGRGVATEGYGTLVDATDDFVSARHLDITLNPEAGVLTIDDRNSTNGSAIIAREATPVNPDAAQWVDDDETVTQDATEPAVKGGESGAVAIVEEVGQHLQPSPEAAQRALATLTEAWGLPEGTTLEVAISKLDAEADALIAALGSLSGFEDVRLAASSQIRESLGTGLNKFGGATRDKINSFLGGAGMQALEGVANLDARLLPPSSRRQLSELQGLLKGLTQSFDATTQPGRTWFDPGAGAQLRRRLDKLPMHQEDIKDALREVQDMQIRIKGFATEIPGEKGRNKDRLAYRNEAVQAWAKELAGGNVTPERLEEITAAMEASVKLESGMIDDPNSPYQWFGERVRSNVNKERSQVPLTGRRDSMFVPAQRYVAELMVDMLRGKFVPNQNGFNDPITLNPRSIGGVEVGQHRAAALAMLYGSKDWQRMAQVNGLILETR